MTGDVITIVTLRDEKKNKTKSTFTTCFHSLCHKYGIKFRYVNLNDIFPGNVVLSEPFMLDDCFSPRLLMRIEKLFPRHRVILTTDILNGIHQYASVISCDPVQISKEVFSYCVMAGRTKIALFAYDHHGLRTEAYIEAYRETAKLYGCTLGNDDVYLNDDRQLSDCFRRFYENKGSYDVVVCANDMAALYLITELQQRGVRVPEDLFVFGFGNSLVSSRVSPSITSIEWSEKERAEQCVALWRYLRKYPEVFNVKITLGHRLVVRESTSGFLPTSDVEKSQSPFPAHVNERGYGPLHALNKFFQNADAIERGVLSGLLAGKNNTEIGDELFLSESAVKYHITKILREFNVSSRKELCQILRYYNIRF